MRVRLIAKTVGFPGTEYENKSLDEIVVGIARVSSSRSINNLFDNSAKLLKHCLLNSHWSIFTTVNLVFEVKTSRAIGRELLRHKATNFQEFSQRYAKVQEFENIELRLQEKSNRQSSERIIDSGHSLQELAYNTIDVIKDAYNVLISGGASRETARFILPESATTTIIMNATLREWITTLNLRLHRTAQKEIRMVAEGIKDYFIAECPIISESLNNFDSAYDIHILDQLTLEKFNVLDIVKEKYVTNY